MTKIISTNRARQGMWGRQVLLVLVAGLLLAGAVWLGLEFYGETIDPQNNAQTGQSVDQ